MKVLLLQTHFECMYQSYNITHGIMAINILLYNILYQDNLYYRHHKGWKFQSTVSWSELEFTNLYFRVFFCRWLCWNRIASPLIIFTELSLIKNIFFIFLQKFVAYHILYNYYFTVTIVSQSLIQDSIQQVSEFSFNMFFCYFTL